MQLEDLIVDKICIAQNGFLIISIGVPEQDANVAENRGINTCSAALPLLASRMISFRSPTSETVKFRTSLIRIPLRAINFKGEFVSFVFGF